MNTTNTISYSFDHEKDKKIGLGHRILLSITTLLSIGAFFFFVDKEELFDPGFFLGFFVAAALFFCAVYFGRRYNANSLYYLRIDNDILVYRFGMLDKEHKVNLERLDYAVYSSTELILRFLDKHELIIDSPMLTNHHEKYAELQDTLKEYINHKKRQNR